MRCTVKEMVDYLSKFPPETIMELCTVESLATIYFPDDDTGGEGIYEDETSEEAFMFPPKEWN